MRLEVAPETQCLVVVLNTILFRCEYFIMTRFSLSITYCFVVPMVILLLPSESVELDLKYIAYVRS